MSSYYKRKKAGRSRLDYNDFEGEPKYDRWVCRGWRRTRRKVFWRIWDGYKRRNPGNIKDWLGMWPAIPAIAIGYVPCLRNVHMMVFSASAISILSRSFFEKVERSIALASSDGVLVTFFFLFLLLFFEYHTPYSARLNKVKRFQCT